MRIFKILAVLVVVLSLSGGALMADNLDLRKITYNAIPEDFSRGGGSFGGAILNGETLPWVYCVQFVLDIDRDLYPDTIVNNTGVIQNSVGLSIVPPPIPSPANALRIAHLLDWYANGADKDTQIAIQAAIWHLDGFGDLTGGTLAQQTLYDTMILDTATGNVADYLWLTPGQGDNHEFQGLVTRVPVPDGGMTLMLLGGALVGLETLRRKYRA